MKGLILLLTLILGAAGAMSLGGVPMGHPAAQSVLLSLRLPRILCAIEVGAALALAGICMQVLLRNALADPFVLGMSGGASLAAVCVALLAPTSLLLGPVAGLGALATAGTVAALARDGGGLLPPTRLVLCGVAVSSVVGSLTSFLLFCAPRERSVRATLYFTAGSLTAPGSAELAAAAALTFGCAVWLWRNAGHMDRLTLGDATAATLGVEVRSLRRRLLLAASLLTGGAVVLGGLVGFVGLVAPHLARLLEGPTHRRALPSAVGIGALLVLAADTAGRSAFGAREMPAGLLTALLGGPLFLWLLRSRDYGFGVER